MSVAAPSSPMSSRAEVRTSGSAWPVSSARLPPPVGRCRAAPGPPRRGARARDGGGDQRFDCLEGAEAAEAAGGGHHVRRARDRRARRRAPGGLRRADVAERERGGRTLPRAVALQQATCSSSRRSPRSNATIRSRDAPLSCRAYFPSRSANTSVSARSAPAARSGLGFDELDRRRPQPCGERLACLVAPDEQVTDDEHEDEQQVGDAARATDPSPIAQRRPRIACTRARSSSGLNGLRM